nr:MAG TPA: hypothetical protein [Caudoviricetes sp.]
MFRRKIKRVIKRSIALRSLIVTILLMLSQLVIVYGLFYGIAVLVNYLVPLP